MLIVLNAHISKTLETVASFLDHPVTQCYCVAKAMLCYTIRYYSVYLTCSKKLTGSQLSLPHGTYRKTKGKGTKNKSRTCGDSITRDHVIFTPER